MATPLSLSVPEFVSRWSLSTLTERAAYQEHFRDLCAIVGQPTPAEADPFGESYAFEKGVRKVGGAGQVDGYADVWKRGCFAIEYKGKRKNLTDAYQQLLTYREDLENPPLLAVCDLNRFEVHTNFTGTVKRVYAFDLRDLERNEPTPLCPLPPLTILPAMFESPELLRPEKSTEAATEEVAAAFGQLARSLALRGHPPHAAAHFLIRLLFCLFAEDIRLLPEGLFTRLVANFKREPARFDRQVKQLFSAMAHGGEFGFEPIRHFNGGLFDDDSTLPLVESDLALLARAADLDWSSIEPSIFGTLFERSLDPSKRSQLGAHYTGQEDIRRIVEPVVLRPLQREWEAVKEKAMAMASERDDAIAEMEARGASVADRERRDLAKRREERDVALRRLLSDFQQQLASVRVLDPACGSGNFLYVALRSVLDLEKSVILLAARCGLTGFFPQVGPEQMRGLEINDYAHELAPITIWIGYIQWLRENGFGLPGEPVLRRFDQIVQQDALLNEDGTEPEWPAADFIIGNPPFLGDKVMRGELGDEYTEKLRTLYAGRVDGGADLVTYWFERARALIKMGQVKRAGLISTNGIRFGANRKVLDRIAAGGGIFAAWPDSPWVLDGAAVRVSIVCFDGGSETDRALDGKPVPRIHSNLTASEADVTTAKPLAENNDLVFLGMMKGGPFDINEATAQGLLAAGPNPNGKSNRDVVRPRLNGQDITSRSRSGWIIDFAELPEDEAALYEAPFEYVRQHVKPLRDTNRDARMNRLWWLHGRPRPALRDALNELKRCIVTPEVSKHRVFAWMPTGTVPDHKLHVFARDDDYFFGVLHSRVHEVWSLALGNRMGVGNDPCYNSSKTFGTFPMPWPPGTEPSEDSSPLVVEIAHAARRLVELRDNVLNVLGSTETLTGLYNKRPSWLDNAHKSLDRAVLAAYADVTDESWPENLNDDEMLIRLLAINQHRAG